MPHFMAGFISEKKVTTIFKGRLSLKEKAKTFYCTVGAKMQLGVWVAL